MTRVQLEDSSVTPSAASASSWVSYHSSLSTSHSLETSVASLPPHTTHWRRFGAQNVGAIVMGPPFYQMSQNGCFVSCLNLVCIVIFLKLSLYNCLCNILQLCCMSCVFSPVLYYLSSTVLFVLCLQPCVALSFFNRFICFVPSTSCFTVLLQTLCSSGSCQLVWEVVLVFNCHLLPIVCICVWSNSVLWSCCVHAFPQVFPVLWNKLWGMSSTFVASGIVAEL